MVIILRHVEQSNHIHGIFFCVCAMLRCRNHRWQHGSICLPTATTRNGTMTETSCLELSVSLLYTVYVGDKILCSLEFKGIWESLLNITSLDRAECFESHPFKGTGLMLQRVFPHQQHNWLVVSTHLKNTHVKLEIFPNFRGENKKCLKPPTK